MWHNVVIRPLCLLTLFPCPLPQKIIDNDGNELAQRAALLVRNPLKLCFRFTAHSHTYGIRTILNWGRLQ